MSAERRGENKVVKYDHVRSEFRYGSFCRSVALPQCADVEDVDQVRMVTVSPEYAHF